MAYEMVIELGRPFDVVLDLPRGSEIRESTRMVRVQFMDQASAEAAMSEIRVTVRQCRDSSDVGATVIKGTLIAGELGP